MAKIDSIKRYNFIIEGLRTKPLSYNEIINSLSRSTELDDYKTTVSKRTFSRDLDDIRLVFGVDIQYDTKIKKYFISDAGQPGFNNRLLEAFDTINTVRVTDKMTSCLLFEDRKPLGTENMNGFIHAIKNNLTIKFAYQKYWENTESQRLVQPYILKEFKNRWYILAKDCNDQTIKSFAIDRISNFEITNKVFEKDNNYDATLAFQHSFGIISPNDQLPQNIVLSFIPNQGKYIKSLPLHHSQKTIVDNENEVRISLKLCITHDFLMEVLSHGESVKVIEPQLLINKIKSVYQEALNQYK